MERADTAQKQGERRLVVELEAPGKWAWAVLARDGSTTARSAAPCSSHYQAIERASAAADAVALSALGPAWRRPPAPDLCGPAPL